MSNDTFDIIVVIIGTFLGVLPPQGYQIVKIFLFLANY